MNADELLDAEIVAWNAEPDAKLVGEIVAISTGANQYHDCYPLLTVHSETDGELYALHAFQTVLADEIAKQNPAQGDRLLLKCLGKPEGKNYVAFRVIVEHTHRSGPPPSMSTTRPGGGPAERVELVSDEQAGEITARLKTIGEWKGIDTVKQAWKDRGFPSIGNLPAARYAEVVAWVETLESEPF